MFCGSSTVDVLMSMFEVNKYFIIYQESKKRKNKANCCMYKGGVSNAMHTLFIFRFHCPKDNLISHHIRDY